MQSNHKSQDCLPRRLRAASWRGLIAIALLLSATNESQAVRITLIGDSTVNNGSSGEAGWGEKFAQYFVPGTVINNRATSGRSSKSFITEGRWTSAVALPADYVLIQFGHNDQKLNDTSRGTYPIDNPSGVPSFGPYDRFRSNLNKFVTESRAKGAEPILISSVARRGHTIDALGQIIFNNAASSSAEEDAFGNAYSLLDYAQAALAVGLQRNAPTVDLNGISLDYYRHLFDSGYDLNDFGPDGTHFYPVTAEIIAKLVVRGLVDSVPHSPLAAAVVPGKVYMAGDLDKNDLLDGNDWTILAANFSLNVNQMIPIEAYLSGDLNLDGTIDRLDRAIFEDFYDSSRHAGAFAAEYLMPGDVNDDGEIDVLHDFESIRINLLKAGSTFNRWDGDLNNDGVIDFLDFGEWKSAYLAMGGSAAMIPEFGSVPEPNSLLLTLISIGWIMLARLLSSANSTP